jgi:type I restriction enzyme, S subunit
VIEGLKRYPAYKDSGVEWLGKVPEHWQVLRGKRLFRCIDERSRTGTEELLTVSSARGVVPRRTALVTMFKAESYVGYKLCWPGDLVINSLWAWARGLGVSWYHGIVSSAYGVYRLNPGLAPTASFFHELVRSTPFQWELQVRSKGIWISRLQLTDEAFLEAPFPVPPGDERAPIVRYLAHAERHIARYIRAKRKLIKLLEEQKQAIIHRAVTRGLDPNVRLKPSGIEWLGDVPEHWEVVKLGQVLTDGPRNGISPPIAQDDSASGLSFSISAVRGGEVDVRPEDIKHVLLSARANSLSTYELKRGDILLVRGNGNVSLVGKAGLVRDDMPGYLYPDILMRIRLVKRLDPEYLVLVLNDKASREQIESLAKTTVGTFKINNQHVRQVWVAVPALDEQQILLREIRREIEQPVRAIDAAQREIDLLREYRTRLISDVVSGKLDVREAAAHLPDEPNPSLEDSIDEIAETDLDELETAVEQEVEA